MSETPLHEGGIENELPKPQWQKPSLEEETEELARHAEESGMDLDALVEAFKTAKLQELSR